MIYNISKEEQEELDELKKELFGDAKFAAFEDFEDHTKTKRYDELMAKKMTRLQMTMN